MYVQKYSKVVIVTEVKADILKFLFFENLSVI